MTAIGDFVDEDAEPEESVLESNEAEGKKKKKGSSDKEKPEDEE